MLCKIHIDNNNEFNYSRITKQMKNEKYIYYSIEDLVIVFPKMIENSIIMEEVASKSNNNDDELHRRRQKLVSKNLIVSYTKALRIFLGDGFPYLMIFKDALSVDAFQSIRDFDFPREIFKKRNKKYDKDEDEIILCFGKIKYNTNTIGFIVSYECASQFFDRTVFYFWWK
jgi:hypothetical protein